MASRSFRGRITRRIMLVGLVPALVVGAVSYVTLNELTASTDKLHANRDALAATLVGEYLGSNAVSVARQVESFMLERISDAREWASAPVIIGAASAARDAHEAQGLTDLDVDAVESRFTIRKELGLAPRSAAYLKRQIELSPHFGEAFFTDSNGFNVALTNPTSDFVQSDEDWWQRARTDGISVGDVEFDESADLWSVEISVRVDDPDSGQFLGVLKTVLGVSLIQEVANRQIELIREGRITVTTGDGLLIAETSSGHARNRIMNPDFSVRKSGGAGMAAGFGAERSGLTLDDDWATAFARSEGPAFYAELFTRFRGFDWVVFVQQPSPIALEALGGLDALEQEIADSRRTILYALAATLIAVVVLGSILSIVFARQITGPIQHLQRMAERVSLGDTSTPVVVDTDDEMAELARSFDRMRLSLAIATQELEGRN